MYSIIYDKEFIAEAHDADLKREYFAKGKAEGQTEGETNTIKKLITLGLLTPEAAKIYSTHSNSEFTFQN